MKQHFAIKGQFASLHKDIMIKAQETRQISGSPTKLAGSDASVSGFLEDRCSPQR
jgi:hypothetical protein